MTTSKDEFGRQQPDPDDEFVAALLSAFTLPMTPQEIQVTSEGYTCGFVPPQHRHLYEDWF